MGNALQTFHREDAMPTATAWRHHEAHSETAASFLGWFETRNPAWWTNALLLAGVAARLIRYLMGNPIWGDEAMLMLNLVDRSWREILDPLGYCQVAPPLFVAGQWAMYRFVGSSEYVLRLVPLAASVASLFAFRSLARTWLPPWPATLAFGLLAVASWPIGMCNTMKPYSCDLLGSILLLIMTTKFLSGRDGSRWLWVMAASAPAILWASFPSVFIAAAVSLVLAAEVWRRPTRGNVLGFAAWNLAWLTAFGLVYALVIAKTPTETQTFMREYWSHAFPPTSPGPLLVWIAASHTGQMFAYPIGAANGGSAATTLLVAVGLFVWAKERRISLLALFAIPLALGIVGSAMGKYPYAASGRLTQHAAPMICLAAGVGLARLLDAQRLFEKGSDPLPDRIQIPQTESKSCQFRGGLTPFRIASQRFLGRGTTWAAASLCAIAGINAATAVAQPYRHAEEVWFRAFFRNAFSAVGPNDLVLFDRDPEDVDMPSLLRWHLIRHRPRVVEAAKVSPETLQRVVGNVWILAFDKRDDSTWVDCQDLPAIAAMSESVKAVAPDRRRLECTTFVLPDKRRDRPLHILHLERWAKTGQEALPRNIAVLP